MLAGTLEHQDRPGSGRRLQPDRLTLTATRHPEAILFDPN